MNGWTISGLKENAKSVLKDFYWKAVLAALIVGLLSGGMGGSSSSASSASRNWDKYKQEIEEQIGSGSSDDGDYSWEEDMESIFDMSLTTQDGTQITLSAPADTVPTAAVQYEKTADSFDSAAIAAFVGIIIVIVLIAAVIGSLYTIFVGNIIQVGYRKFHLDARFERNNIDIMKVFSSFKNGYGNVAKTMFLRDLYIFLWSLLFIIPGIIKSYEYFLVPYILAENPNIDSKRAFEISRKTMDGEKMNCFLLGLSFIGWSLLAYIIPLGVGYIFLNPYLYATYAEFYCCMKAKALANGIAFAGELPDDYSADTSFDQSYPTSSSYDSYSGYNPAQNVSDPFSTPRAPQDDNYNGSGMRPYQPYNDYNHPSVDPASQHSAPSQPADGGYPSGTMDEIGDIDTSSLDKTDDDMGL